MRVKEALLSDYERECVMQDYDPMEELHHDAHFAMLKASELLTADEIKIMCYITGLNSSDYIKQGEAQ
jgi:hypothetical protein